MTFLDAAMRGDRLGVLKVIENGQQVRSFYPLFYHGNMITIVPEIIIIHNRSNFI